MVFSEVVRWIGDETLLQNLVFGLPTIVLVVAIAFCVLMLSKGADWMIDGVVHLARRTGLPRIVIGATIISLGTTMPEAFVSVMAAWMGNPGLALGNGVGSIIADTGLIFGLLCILSRVPVNRFILNRTGWVQVGAATLLVTISMLLLGRTEGEPILHRWVGFLFLFLLVCYMYTTYRWAKHGSAIEGEDADDSQLIKLGISCLLIGGGLFLVIVGARILIPCAVCLADRLGVPNDVIAATMVALGTSLPELVTGIDVLNCLFVIGAAAAARPLGVPPNFFTFHFPAMILILYPFRFFIFINRDGWFKRWQGGWLFGLYLIYLILQYAYNIHTV
jgi:cation:H+ antiporter